jgi:hypothetical protein
MIPLWALMAAGGLMGLQKAHRQQQMVDQNKEATAAQQQYSGFTGQKPEAYTPQQAETPLMGAVGGGLQGLSIGATTNDLWSKMNAQGTPNDLVGSLPGENSYENQPGFVGPKRNPAFYGRG